MRGQRRLSLYLISIAQLLTKLRGDALAQQPYASRRRVFACLALLALPPTLKLSVQVIEAQSGWMVWLTARSWFPDVVGASMFLAALAWRPSECRASAEQRVVFAGLLALPLPILKTLDIAAGSGDLGDWTWRMVLVFSVTLAVGGWFLAWSYWSAWIVFPTLLFPALKLAGLMPLEWSMVAGATLCITLISSLLVLAAHGGGD